MQAGALRQGSRHGWGPVPGPGRPTWLSFLLFLVLSRPRGKPPQPECESRKSRVQQRRRTTGCWNSILISGRPQLIYPCHTSSPAFPTSPTGVPFPRFLFSLPFNVFRRTSRMVFEVTSPRIIWQQRRPRPDVKIWGTSYGEAHLDSEASCTFGPSFMITVAQQVRRYKAESIPDQMPLYPPVTQDSFVLQWGGHVEKPKGMDEAMTEKLSRVLHRGRQQGFLAGTSRSGNTRPASTTTRCWSRKTAPCTYAAGYHSSKPPNVADSHGLFLTFFEIEVYTSVVQTKVAL